MNRFTVLLLGSLVLAGPAYAAAPPPASFEEAISLYQDGNYIEAKKIAEMWAEKDDPRAYVMLGTILQRGLGVEVDLGQAKIWYQKGADKADAESELALAMLYLAGSTQKPDVVDGAPWLQKAAEAGNVKAQLNLGLYYTGIYGTQADWPNSAKWFTAAADKGNPRAQYNLALLHMDGEGVQKDEALGAKWLLIAAQHGNAVAQNRIARILAIGVPGVRQDVIEAMKWNILAKKGGRGDLELDDAATKADPGMLKDAETRAAAFKPLPDPTAQ